MLRRSGEAEDNAADVAKLDELKKRLLNAIDAYLLKAESKTVKVSIANPQNFRLHVMRGEDGVARAKRYRDYISNHKVYNELVEKLVADIKDAYKTQQEYTLKVKTTELLSWTYDYARSAMSGYWNGASSESETALKDEEKPLSLGNSEALTLSLAKAICEHLDLNPRNEMLVKELSAVNPDAAKAYEASELMRIIVVIDKFMESKVPAAVYRK